MFHVIKKKLGHNASGTATAPPATAAVNDTSRRGSSAAVTRINKGDKHGMGRAGGSVPCVDDAEKAGEIISQPQDFDILLGRGKQSFNHIGNRRFRVFIGMHLHRYMEAGSRMEKTMVVNQVCEAIHEAGGRFIKQGEDKMSWYVVPKKVAREKVSHAMRDAVNNRVKSQNTTSSVTSGSSREDASSLSTEGFSTVASLDETRRSELFGNRSAVNIAPTAGFPAAPHSAIPMPGFHPSFPHPGAPNMFMPNTIPPSFHSAPAGPVFGAPNTYLVHQQRHLQQQHQPQPQSLSLLLPRPPQQPGEPSPFHQASCGLDEHTRKTALQYAAAQEQLQARRRLVASAALAQQQQQIPRFGPKLVGSSSSAPFGLQSSTGTETTTASTRAPSSDMSCDSIDDQPRQAFKANDSLKSGKNEAPAYRMRKKKRTDEMSRASSDRKSVISGTSAKTKESRESDYSLDSQVLDDFESIMSLSIGKSTNGSSSQGRSGLSSQEQQNQQKFQKSAIYNLLKDPDFLFNKRKHMDHLPRAMGNSDDHSGGSCDSGTTMLTGLNSHHSIRALDAAPVDTTHSSHLDSISSKHESHCHSFIESLDTSEERTLMGQLTQQLDGGGSGGGGGELTNGFDAATGGGIRRIPPAAPAVGEAGEGLSVSIAMPHHPHQKPSPFAFGGLSS